MRNITKLSLMLAIAETVVIELVFKWRFSLSKASRLFTGTWLHRYTIGILRWCCCSCCGLLIPLHILICVWELSSSFMSSTWSRSIWSWWVSFKYMHWLWYTAWWSLLLVVHFVGIGLSSLPWSTSVERWSKLSRVWPALYLCKSAVIHFVSLFHYLNDIRLCV